jgi:hypothetical protein
MSATTTAPSKKLVNAFFGATIKGRYSLPGPDAGPSGKVLTQKAHLALEADSFFTLRFYEFLHQLGAEWIKNTPPEDDTTTETMPMPGFAKEVWKRLDRLYGIPGEFRNDYAHKAAWYGIFNPKGASTNEATEALGHYTALCLMNVSMGAINSFVEAVVEGEDITRVIKHHFWKWAMFLRSENYGNANAFSLELNPDKLCFTYYIIKDAYNDKLNYDTPLDRAPAGWEDGESLADVKIVSMRIAGKHQRTRNLVEKLGANVRMYMDTSAPPAPSEEEDPK